MDLTKVLETLNKDKPDSLSALNSILDKALAAEEVTEEVEETVEETTEEETTEETAEEETSEEETVEEEAEEETVEEEESSDDALTGVLAIMQELRVENENLRAENARLQAQLSTAKKAEKDFVEKFKNLSVSIREEKKPEKPVERHQIGMTNGIGEL